MLYVQSINYIFSLCKRAKNLLVVYILSYFIFSITKIKKYVVIRVMLLRYALQTIIIIDKYKMLIKNGIDYKYLYSAKILTLR